MATEIFDYCPELDYSFVDVQPAVLFEYAGNGSQQRATLQPIARRTYTWPLRRQDVDRAAITEFFRVASQTVTAFYIKDPKESEHARTGVSLGTAGVAQTVFDLPATGENQRDYIVDDANVIVYDDGNPVTVASVDIDARTITLSAAPANLSVMTADYHAYRLVHLVSEPSWSGLGPDYFSATAEFQEVVA